MVGTQAIGCNAVYHGEDATYSHAEAHRLPCLSPNPSINIRASQEQMLQIKVQSEELLFLVSVDVVSILCCRMSGRIFLIPVMPKLGERWPTKSHVLANMCTKPVYGMCVDLTMGPFGRPSLPPSLALRMFPPSASRSYLTLRPTPILP